MKERLLGVQEAAEILGVKPKTLYEWKYRKQNLPFVKIGKSLKIREQDLLDFIERNTKKPKELSAQ